MNRTNSEHVSIMKQLEHIVGGVNSPSRGIMQLAAVHLQ